MSHLLNTLSVEDFSLFRKKKAVKGETIFLEGEVCKTLGIVKSGSLVISSFTFEGKEIIFNTILPDMMFGNNLLFSKEPYFKGNVIALSNAEIYLIKEDDLLTLLSRNKSFLKQYLSILANSEIELHTRIKMLSFPSLSERLAYALYLNDGILPYKSILGLSKDLNVERETLSRYISKMVSDGLLLKEEHRLIDKTKKEKRPD